MKILNKDPYTADACYLMDELSMALEAITGDSGRNSFNVEDVCVSGALFVIAYNDKDEAIGCGAIRPISGEIAEIKRMYAKTKAKGVGTEILGYLETQAKEMGYSVLWLETRLVNRQAIAFYESRGYQRILNYGKYVDRPEAVCFGKNIG